MNSATTFMQVTEITPKLVLAENTAGNLTITVGPK